MKAEVTDITSVKKRLDIEVPAEVVSSETTAIAREFAKRARVPGFRPGKAPLAVVRNRYRADILSELYEQLLPRHFLEAVREKGLDVVDGSMSFEPPEYHGGGPLSFQVGFEVFPVFEVGDYSEIPVEETPTDVTEDDVAGYIEKLADDKAEMAPVEEDRPLRAGDHAAIALNAAFVDGAAEGAPAFPEKQVLCEIGGEDTFEEFTENLTGANVGEDRSFEVAYPEGHPDQRLAGRTIRCDARVEGIRQKIRPAVDDEFARELGDFQTLADLRAEVRRNMEQSLRERADNATREGLIRWLVDNNDFEVPDSLVAQQAQAGVERAARNLAGRGVDLESARFDWGELRAKLYPQAVRDVRGRLILAHLAEKERIEVTDDDVEDQIRKMAAAIGRPAAKLRAQLDGEGGLEALRERIRDDKVVASLRGRARFVPPGSLTAGGREPSAEPSLEP